MSTSSQEREVRAWCDREGWSVVDVIIDNDRSATRFATKEREGYKQIHAGLDVGRWGRIDLLAMWESSRGERGLDGHVQLRNLCSRHGMHLAYRGRVLDMDDGDDRFTAGLDALLDEREAERARERTLRSHRDSVARGLPRGSVPYGYRREYEQGTRRMIAQVPDETTAPIVKGIVADLLRGATLYEIAKGLTAVGAPTPQGERAKRHGREPQGSGWTASMIRNMLAKRSLMGVRTHKGLVTGPGAWEPIVPPADWVAVQKILADPSRANYHGGLEAAWLLSGIATCGVCGAWLRPMRNSGRMMYVCAGKAPTSPKGHVARGQEPLDAYIEVAVTARLSRPDALQVFAAPEVSDGRQAVLRGELQDARAQLAEYEASAGTPGGVSASAFARIEARLSARIGELEQRLAPPVALPAVVRELAGSDVAHRWDGLDVAGRRLVVRTLLEVAVLPVTKRGVRGFDPGLVRLVWRGRT